MEAIEKLNILAEGAQFEAASHLANRKKPSVAALCTAKDSGTARATRLLRVLQTNRCDRGCAYCPLRVQNDTVARTSFEPEELAKLFLQFDSRRMTDGLFLSSGSDNGADASMEKVVKTAAVLREKYKYKGYIHLKVLPGASFGLVEEAARLADRLSVNLEAPSAERLEGLAGQKNFFADIITRMEWINTLRQERGWLKAGQSTQMVVGVNQESDQEILKTSQWLYRTMKLNRVYYGAFAPIAGTPLENQPATSARRQQRLYQSDWLISDYDFGFDELPFTDNGNLPTNIDPKVAWALQQPARFPVEINQAEKAELLRIPGIGPLSAERILAFRTNFPFKSLQSLKQTGAVVTRARDFITIDGRYYGAPAELLYRAGQHLRHTSNVASEQPNLRQLSLPLEWKLENLLPLRQSISAAELAWD